MLANYDREKLINAVVYLTRNTKNCGVTKLFKLLYFLDFEHFKQIGRSVTGLTYYAWKMGPVPVSLYDELNAPEQDMADSVSLTTIPTRFKNPFIKIEPKIEFDDSHFSKRELRILQELAERYKDSVADDLVEATHIDTLPWHRVFVEENRRQEEIPYIYALRKDEMELMTFVKKENDEIIQNYKE